MSRKPELIILRGLPASGKTYWAKAWVAEDRKHRFRVNKDDLRQMVDDGTYTADTEQRILAARDILVQKLMERGLSVVVDDTNFAAYHIKKLARIAHHAAWDWKVIDFPIPLAEAIQRDAKRELRDYVGREVIQDMYDKYLRQRNGEFPPIPTETELISDLEADNLYVPKKGTPLAIIIDIDGTIALKGTRNPFDESRVYEDTPNWPIINAILADVFTNDVQPIFMSGRTAGCEEDTRDWIEKHIGLTDPEYNLYMRAVGDNRADNIVKLEIFDRHVRYAFNVQRVYDDRNQVVAMWRSLGLTVLQVADGNF